MPNKNQPKSLKDIASSKAIDLAAGAVKKTITKGVTGALAGLALSHAKKKITQSLTKSAKEAVIDKVISKGNRESLNEVSHHATEFLKKKKEQFLGKKEVGSVLKEEQGETKPMNGVNEKTNFAAFITYIVTDHKYKDALGDCAIISFLATKCAKEDIVLGRAADWEQIIQHARLLEGSAATKPSAKKLTKDMVQMHFGKELAQEFGEHFGINTVKKIPDLASKRAAAKPATKTVRAPKA